jgi:hypothetical protein
MWWYVGVKWSGRDVGLKGAVQTVFTRARSLLVDQGQRKGVRWQRWRWLAVGGRRGSKQTEQGFVSLRLDKTLETKVLIVWMRYL